MNKLNLRNIVPGGADTSVANPITTTFEGSFDLKRLEFAVGDGIWADTSVVADAIQIRFRAVAARSGK